MRYDVCNVDVDVSRKSAVFMKSSYAFLPFGWLLFSDLEAEEERPHEDPNIAARSRWLIGPGRPGLKTLRIDRLVR